MSDIERLRSTILARRKPDVTDEHAWRRIEALVLRVCGATNIHQLAEAVDGWRQAERMVWELPPQPQPSERVEEVVEG